MANDVIDYQPSDKSTETSGAVFHNHETAVFQIVNETSVTVNYDIEGTYDGDDFSDAHTIVSGNSVSANSVGSHVLTEPWDKIRVKTTPQSSPGGSSDVIVKEHTRG